MKEQYSASYTNMNFCLKMTADGLGGGGEKTAKAGGRIHDITEKKQKLQERSSLREANETAQNSVDEYGIPRVEM